VEIRAPQAAHAKMISGQGAPGAGMLAKRRQRLTAATIANARAIRPRVRLHQLVESLIERTDTILLPVRFSAWSESGVHGRRGFAQKGRDDAAVGIHRHRDLAVPQDLHDNSGGHLLGEQQGGAPVAQVVEAHLGDAGHRELALEGMERPFWVHGSPVLPVKTKPVSCHLEPAASWASTWPLRSAWSASATASGRGRARVDCLDLGLPNTH